MLTASRRQRLLATARAAEQKSSDPTRRKCFLSYHSDDVDEVEAFLDTFGSVFLPRVIGVSDEDDFVDSTNTGYVMDCLREKYLTDSTVTIVLVGRCTWARRYVDWESYSTLRQDKKNRLGGLMGITLQSVANSATKRLPDRLMDNVSGPNGDAGYARWWKYPKTSSQLRGYIEHAYRARSECSHLINNSRSRKAYNSSC